MLHICLKRYVARSLNTTSRGLENRAAYLQRCSVAWSLCTTWLRGVSLHHVASRGLSAPRNVAQSLCTTWHRAVSLYAVASRGPSARRSYARSLCTISRRAVPLRHVASRGPSPRHGASTRPTCASTRQCWLKLWVMCTILWCCCDCTARSAPTTNV